MKDKHELFDYDPSIILDTEEKMIAYLNAELAEGDPHYIRVALQILASKYSITNIAEKTGILEETITAALSIDIDPGFSVIEKIIKALDMRLTVVPTKNIANSKL